jgi:hypothetical protein
VQRALTEAFELTLAPLDRARVRVLRGLMPVSSRLAAAREPRVALIGVSVVGFGLMASVIAPLWLLALGPIVLGVPHLLADFRYCVVRPGWHRERRLWLGAGVPLLAIALGAGLEWGLLGVAASALLIDGEQRRRLGVAFAALVLAGAVRLVGDTADLIFAHGHNFVAVALWAAWRPREGRLHLLVLVAFAVGGAALLAGLGDAAWSSSLARDLPTGLDARTHAATLAPDLPQTWALRLVLLYCFAQSVHYGVWLRLVPEDDRDRPTPRSFRASFRALCAEIHPLVLLAVGLGALGLALWACVDLADARVGYLRFARFHGMLELCAAGLLIVRGRSS